MADREANNKDKDKDVTIVVNAQEKSVESENVSFEQVTTIAYPTPPFADTMYTVTYRHAKEPKEGSLVAGQSVLVKKRGTVFNVEPTDKS